MFRWLRGYGCGDRRRRWPAFQCAHTVLDARETRVQPNGLDERHNRYNRKCEQHTTK